MKREFIFPHNLPLNTDSAPTMLARFFEMSEEGMIVLDQVGKVVSINPAFKNLLGFDVDDLLRKNVSFLFSGIKTPHYYEKFLDDLIKTGYWHNKIDARKKSGAVVHLDARFSEIKDENGYANYYVGVCSAVSNFLNKNGVEYNPLRDSLTSAYNIHAFSEFLDRAIDRVQAGLSKLTLMFVNVDKFSVFNEKYGILEGDKVLVKIADVLKKNLFKTDIICRVKDDNFAIIVGGQHTQEDLEQIVHKIFVALIDKQPFGDKSKDFSISIGSASFTDDVKDGHDLLKKTIRAMKQAKQNGGNQVVYNRYI